MKAINKVINTESEFYGSYEMDQIWEGFQGREAKEKVGRQFEFVKGFTVSYDPYKNYGKDFRLYKIYISDGIRFCRQEEKSGMLSNSRLEAFKIEKGNVVSIGLFFGKTAEFRTLMGMLSQTMPNIFFAEEGTF